MTAASPPPADSSLLIRPMLAADLDAVLAIAAACPEAPRWTAADYAAYFAASEATPSLLRAAVVAIRPVSSILGFAAATLRPDPAATGSQSGPGSTLCELDSIAVPPDGRRQGIGAALLRAALAWAAQHAARRLVLEVRASNTPALALYRRDGLRIEGRRPRYYAHPEEDALLLGTDVTFAPARNPFSTEIPIEGGPPRC
ncbi:MAG: GNAT family N-acetyltransferase [Acidobacteriaceae bacterium]